jgi:hypothetical protein
MKKALEWISKADTGIEELRQLLHKCNLTFDAQHDLGNKIARIRDDLYMAHKVIEKELGD